MKKSDIFNAINTPKKKVSPPPTPVYVGASMSPQEKQAVKKIITGEIGALTPEQIEKITEQAIEAVKEEVGDVFGLNEEEVKALIKEEIDKLPEPLTEQDIKDIINTVIEQISFADKQWVKDNALTIETGGTFIQGVAFDGSGLPTFQQWLDANVNNKIITGAINITISQDINNAILIRNIVATADQILTINATARIATNLIMRNIGCGIVLNGSAPTSTNMLRASDFEYVLVQGDTNYGDAQFLTSGRALIGDGAGTTRPTFNTSLSISNGASGFLRTVVSGGALHVAGTLLISQLNSEVNFTTISVTGQIIDNRPNRPLETFIRVAAEAINTNTDLRTIASTTPNGQRRIVLTNQTVVPGENGYPTDAVATTNGTFLVEYQLVSGVRHTIRLTELISANAKSWIGTYGSIGSNITWERLGGGETPDNTFTLVPDYDNMETTNRITSTTGTWTIQRDGFIIISTHSTNAAATYTINDRVIRAVGTSSATIDTLLIPVSAGDVIGWNNIIIGVTNPVLYFIPPKPLWTSTDAVKFNVRLIGQPDTHNPGAVTTVDSGGTWTSPGDGYVQIWASIPAGGWVRVAGPMTMLDLIHTPAGSAAGIVQVSRGQVLTSSSSGPQINLRFVPPLTVAPMMVRGVDLVSSQDQWKVRIDPDTKEMIVNGRRQVLIGEFPSFAMLCRQGEGRYVLRADVLRSWEDRPPLPASVLDSFMFTLDVKLSGSIPGQIIPVQVELTSVSTASGPTIIIHGRMNSAGEMMSQAWVTLGGGVETTTVSLAGTTVALQKRNGIVRMTNFANTNAVTAAAVLATLPVGWRPIVATAQYWYNMQGAVIGSIHVATNGNIHIDNSVAANGGRSYTMMWFCAE